MMGPKNLPAMCITTGLNTFSCCDLKGLQLRNFDAAQLSYGGSLDDSFFDEGNLLLFSSLKYVDVSTLNQ